MAYHELQIRVGWTVPEEHELTTEDNLPSEDPNWKTQGEFNAMAFDQLSTAISDNFVGSYNNTDTPEVTLLERI